MGQSEMSALQTMVPVHDVNGHVVPAIRSDSPAGQPGNGFGERDHKDLQATLLQKLGQVWNRIVALIPGIAHPLCNHLGVRFVGQTRGRDGWSPMRSAKFESFLDGQIAIDLVHDLGLDPRAVLG